MFPVLLAQATDLTDPLSLTNTANDAASAAAGGAVLAGFAGVMIFVWILAIVGFVFWIWALIDVIRRQFTNPSDKTLWIILVVILGYLGAILYLIIGRKKGTIPSGGA